MTNLWAGAALETSRQAGMKDEAGAEIIQTLEGQTVALIGRSVTEQSYPAWLLYIFTF